MKRIIKLKESDLHRIISESVKRALSEGEAWANQPPIDKFHPDWWYYRQEIEPKGVEDFDPGLDSDDDVEYGRRKDRSDESRLNRIIRESIKRVISESEDEFVPHGYYADSNWGGKEVQISDSGDAARFRRNYGTPEDPTDWLEIQ